MSTHYAKLSDATLEIHGNQLRLKDRSGTEMLIQGWPEIEAKVRSPRRDWHSAMGASVDIQTGLLPGLRPPGVFWLPFRQLRAAQRGESVGVYPTLWKPLLKEMEPVRRFFEEGVPREVYHEVIPFIRQQLPVLKFLAESGDKGLSLMQRNPVLGWGVASREGFSLQADLPLATLLDQPDAKLVTLLGFPECETTCEFLRKVVPEDCSIRRLKQAVPQFSNPRWLELPLLNRWVLDFLASHHLETICWEVLMEATLFADRCAPWGSGDSLLKSATQGYELVNGHLPAPETFGSLGELFHYGEMVTEDSGFDISDTYGGV